MLLPISDGDRLGTVTTQATLACRDDLDIEIVYRMIKALLDNLDIMPKSYAMGKFITLDTALDARPSLSILASRSTIAISSL